MIRASLKTWILHTSCTQHLTSVEEKNFKLRKRREDVIPGKLYVSNTFFAKVKKKSMKGFEANDCKKIGQKSTFIIT